MKKRAYIILSATIAIAACNKEVVDQSEVNDVKVGILSAEIETLDTKATMNGSYQLLWSSGDKIALYVNDGSWTDKNQPFTLVGEGGSTSGRFQWDHGNFGNANANAAFFPWQGQAGEGYNSISGTTLYITLPSSYSNYTSGQMLTPLMAKVTYDSDNSRYNLIHFKHIGGAVKLTINKVPAKAHCVAMTVEGKNIHGYAGAVSPANADTGEEKLVAGSGSNDTVNLDIDDTGSSERNFDFIFPVPTMTSPTLTFNMYGPGDLVLWRAKASNQSNIGRADILAFDSDKAITLSEAQVATNVLKYNNFYLRGWNINNDGADYAGNDYAFASGSLNHTFGGLAYVNVYANGHTYQAQNDAHYFGSYVDFDPTTYLGSSTGDLNLILNYGNGNAQTQDGMITLSSDNVYYVRVYKDNDNNYLQQYTPDVSNYSGMDAGLASGNKRIWIRADGDPSFNGLGITNAHMWGSKSSTSWPGVGVSTDKHLAANPVTLGPSYATSDKVAIPAGAKALKIAYNADGTLTLSY